MEVYSQPPLPSPVSEEKKWHKRVVCLWCRTGCGARCVVWWSVISTCEERGESVCCQYRHRQWVEQQPSPVCWLQWVMSSLYWDISQHSPVSPWQWTHQHSQPATNQLFIGSKLRLLLIPEWGAERERGREDHVTRRDIPPHCCLPSIGQLSNIIIIILSWPVFQIENHRDSPLIPEWILIPKSGIRIRISKSTFCPEIWPHDSSSSY